MLHSLRFKSDFALSLQIVILQIVILQIVILQIVILQIVILQIVILLNVVAIMSVVVAVGGIFARSLAINFANVSVA
jgi:hypothetical protein